MSHIPVLANEILNFFEPRDGSNYVDCTVGEGGHAELILAQNGPSGMLLGIDRDRAILDKAEKNLERFNKRVILIRDTYANLSEIISIYNFKSIYGILFDLGISSYHVEDAGGGFSFSKDEPLDMRFDRESSEDTARDILKKWSEEQLEWLFSTYGEDNYAKVLAQEIVRIREKYPLRTTNDLVEVVRRVKKHSDKKINPATQIFQALRIVVNHELEELEDALPQAVNELIPGGRLAVISYHSLEDRLVKHFLLKKQHEAQIKILTDKPIVPSLIEQKENPRSRSAKLRLAEKLYR